MFMLNIKSVKTSFLFLIGINSLLALAISIFSAFISLGLNPSEVIASVFANLGNHLIFKTASSSASLVTLILFYILVVSSAIIVASYILLMIRSRKINFILELIGFIVVFTMSLLFISNFESFYHQPLLNGDVFLVILFALTIISYFAFFPVLLINRYVVLPRKKVISSGDDVSLEASITLEECVIEEVTNESSLSGIGSSVIVNVNNNFEDTSNLKSSSTSIQIEQESVPEIAKTRKTTTRKITGNRKDIETRFKSANPDGEKTWQSVDKFAVKLHNSSNEIKNSYNRIKHALLQYGLSSRITASGDIFRLNRKTYCKIAILSNYMKVFFNLDKERYIGSTTSALAISNVDANKDTPVVYKIMKPEFDVPRIMTLIKQMCEANRLIFANLPMRNYFQEVII